MTRRKYNYKITTTRTYEHIEGVGHFMTHVWDKLDDVKIESVMIKDHDKDGDICED